MDKQREYEGKDLEEAIQNASASLRIPQDELHYQIVEQGRKGVFGLGARSVRISIMPPVDTLTEAEILGTPRGRAGPAAPAAERESALDAEEPTRGEPDLGPAPAEVEQVRQTLQHMLELIGVDVAVSPGAPGRTGLQLDLTGADQKRLMEKDGELLSALQLVLNRMARRAWPGVGRIQLARDGERRRRDDELVDLARETARQVEQSGRTKKLHPMNAYERRLVHLTVREFRGLTSSSVGSGALKRVSIAKIQNSL